jgi:hypothetical protein
MEILSILVFLGNHCTCRDRWFSHLVDLHFPVEIRILEIRLSLFWNSVRNAHIHSSGRQHSVDLTKHLLWVRAWAISTENRVKGSLVYDTVKHSIFELETPDIHLFVLGWMKILHSILGHFSLYRSVICLITVIEMSTFVMWLYPSSYISSDIPTISYNLTWIASSYVKNLKRWGDILSHSIFNAWVSLIPIKWFWVSMQMSTIPYL